MYKAIIFDYGNTLANPASLTNSLEDVLSSEYAVPIGREIEKAIGNLYTPNQVEQPDWLEVWETCFHKFGLDFEEQLGRKHLEAFCRMSELFPDVRSLLSELNELGIKIGLLSNVTGPSDVFQKDLERRGLAEYFDVVIWSSSIGYRKPSLQSFEAVLYGLEVEPNEALMVGDSEIADIGGATNIGMDSALVSDTEKTQTKARYRVASNSLFNDVLAITSVG